MTTKISKMKIRGHIKKHSKNPEEYTAVVTYHIELPGGKYRQFEAEYKIKDSDELEELGRILTHFGIELKEFKKISDIYPAQRQ